MKAEVLKAQLHNYLLGALPEAEQTALEQELLADRAKFDEAWAVENDLIDRYVRDEMPNAECARFEQYYLASPLHRERVAIAKTWLAEIDEVSEAVPAKASWWERWREALPMPQLAFSGALAVALLLTLSGALWLWRERAQVNDQLAQLRGQSQAETERRAVLQQQFAHELSQEQRRNQQLKAELDKLQQQKEPVAAPVLLSFLLTSATTRAGNSSPTVIPRNQRGAQLLMELSGATYTSYRATLQTVEGRALFSPSARATKDRAFVAVTLPAARLVRGDYVVILSGRKTNGSTEEIDRYFFRIQ